MIRYLLFDLDNTLYPSSLPMDKGITARMMRFIADFLNVSIEEAREIRFGPKKHYSTTLEWLTTDYGFSDTERFFDTVHPESEITELSFDPNLRPFLQSLNMPLSILTNSPRIHAERVLSFYKIDDLFTSVIDIEKNNLRGKPHKSAFLNALTLSGFSIDETLFFDDYPSYLLGFQELGGKTVLVNDNLSTPPLGLHCAHIKTIYETPGVLEQLRFSDA
jgi:putative hydrolase of the HAD superfamily